MYLYLFSECILELFPSCIARSSLNSSFVPAILCTSCKRVLTICDYGAAKVSLKWVGPIKKIGSETSCRALLGWMWYTVTPVLPCTRYRMHAVYMMDHHVGGHWQRP